MSTIRSDGFPKFHLDPSKLKAEEQLSAFTEEVVAYAKAHFQQKDVEAHYLEALKENKIPDDLIKSWTRSLHEALEPIQVSFENGVTGSISKDIQTLLKDSSPFFTRLWGGKFKEAAEGEGFSLPDVTEEEFIALIDFLKAPENPLPSENIPSLAILAERFLIKAPLKQKLSDKFSQIISEGDIKALDAMIRLFNKKIPDDVSHFNEYLSNYLNRLPSFTLEDFKSLVSKIKDLPFHIDLRFLREKFALDDEWLQAFAPLQNLTSLEFYSKSPLTDKSLSFLPISLTWLSISPLEREEDDITGIGLKHLTNLEHLELFDCKTTPDGLAAAVAEMKKLGSISFEDCHISDEHLKALEKLPLTALKIVNFEEDLVTSKGFSYLKSMPLQCLSISGGLEPDDEWIQQLNPTHLEVLYIPRAKITDKTLIWLQQSPIAALDITRCTIEDKDLPLLLQLPKIQEHGFLWLGKHYGRNGPGEQMLNGAATKSKRDWLKRPQEVPVRFWPPRFPWLQQSQAKL